MDIIVYSVITIHLPPLPLSTYRNALPPTPHLLENGNLPRYRTYPSPSYITIQQPEHQSINRPLIKLPKPQHHTTIPLFEIQHVVPLTAAQKRRPRQSNYSNPRNQVHHASHYRKRKSPPTLPTFRHIIAGQTTNKANHIIGNVRVLGLPVLKKGFRRTSASKFYGRLEQKL